MVPVQLLHQRAGPVRNVGWRLYIVYDQHIWRGDLLADRMDGGAYQCSCSFVTVMV
jgi:hypothetical protein